jgi:hypothetical protein
MFLSLLHNGCHTPTDDSPEAMFSDLMEKQNDNPEDKISLQLMDSEGPIPLNFVFHMSKSEMVLTLLLQPQCSAWYKVHGQSIDT